MHNINGIQTDPEQNENRNQKRNEEQWFIEYRH